MDIRKVIKNAYAINPAIDEVIEQIPLGILDFDVMCNQKYTRISFSIGPELLLLGKAYDPVQIRVFGLEDFVSEVYADDAEPLSILLFNGIVHTLIYDKKVTMNNLTWNASFVVKMTCQKMYRAPKNSVSFSLSVKQGDRFRTIYSFRKTPWRSQDDPFRGIATEPIIQKTKTILSAIAPDLDWFTIPKSFTGIYW